VVATPVLAMKIKGISFEDTGLPYATDDNLQHFAATHCIPAKVLLLKYEGQMIWDSVADIGFVRTLERGGNGFACDR